MCNVTSKFCIKLAKCLNSFYENYDIGRAFLGGDIRPVSLLFDQPTYVYICAYSGYFQVLTQHARCA